jgi:hypothetical protein
LDSININYYVHLEGGDQQGPLTPTLTYSGTNRTYPRAGSIAY